MVAENEGNVFASAEIRQPVPREDAFVDDDDVLPERCDPFQKRIRVAMRVPRVPTGATRTSHLLSLR